ncbi:MAG: glycosyltransferase, partial [Candidatus Omnitrophota bacterium]
MKILSISNLDIWPAGEKKGIPSIYFSQKIFRERGHEIYFLCPANNNKSGYTDYQGIRISRFKVPFASLFNLISILRLDRFWSHLLSTFFSNLQWFLFQFFCFFWAIKSALRFRPDLIYVHSLTPAFVGWLISKIFKTRLVIRVYGTDNLYWAFKKPLLRIKNFRDYLAFKLGADYFVITKDGTRGADLAQLLGVNKDKILDYRNGVDFDIYNPDPHLKEKICKDLGVDSDSKIILSLARLVPFYGLDKLISSLPELFRLNPQAICVFAGDGPQRSQLVEFVKRKNIEQRVLFLGNIERELVVKLLNICEVFVAFSKYSNTNNSLLEAMVCAKCIVSLKDDTIRETLTDG